jgi:uncharacterized membrane protein
MSAQDRGTLAPEYGNTAETTSDTRYRFPFGLAGIAALPAVWLGLFTLVGLVVRLYRLDARGFWWDEIAFAYSARLNSPSEVLFLTSLSRDQNPLSFFLPWLVRGLGGSEWSVRLPFAIAGTLCVPAIYLLGRELAGLRAGLVAALLFALSPFAVFHSQDVHPYAPLLLFTILQVFFAYRCAVYGRWFDWSSFSLVSILNLYNDFLALIVSAVVALFLTLVLAGRLVGMARMRGNRVGLLRTSSSPRPGMQFIFAITSLATISLAYLPWLLLTLSFLTSPLLGFNMLPPGRHGSFADLQTLSHGLGFNWFFVALLSTGTADVLVTLVRERRLSSLLIVIWLVLPLVGFWLRAGDIMFLLLAQYYSFLFPAAIVLIAMGIEWLIRFVTGLYLRLLYPRMRLGAASTIEESSWTYKMPMRVLYGVLLVAALAQTSVALAESYSEPQVTPQDFRGAVDRIIADSTPGSMVLELGMWGIKPAPDPDKAIDGIDYYLWLRHSPIKLIDGSLLDEYMVAHITNPDATIWGVDALPWPLTAEQTQHATDLGLEVTQLENVALLRQRAPRGTPAEQIDLLLNWGREIQPGLVATRAMLNPDFRSATLGDNILPPASDVQIPARAGNLLNGEEQQDRWVLWSGASLSPDARTLVLSSDGSQPMANLTLSTRKLIPGKTYVLTFRYRNAHLKGDQRIYLSTYTDNGSLVDTYPYEEGFRCPRDLDSESTFAFRFPQLATSAVLWLQIEGAGTAGFSSVDLRPVK